MTQRELYESKTEQLVLPIVSENGFELVDIDYEKEVSDFYLRVYIDKPGGITIDDCELVSRALSDRLDEADFIKDAYILEVSSPGLTRPLKKDKDFDRNIGKLIDLRLFKAVEKRKEFTATLIAYDKDSVTVEVDELELVLERKNISMIRQAFV